MNRTFAFDNPLTFTREFYAEGQLVPFEKVSHTEILKEPLKYGRWRPGVYDLYQRPIGLLPHRPEFKTTSYVVYEGLMGLEHGVGVNYAELERERRYDKLLRKGLWSLSDARETSRQTGGE